MQRDQELDVQTGAGANLAEPTEQASRVAEGIACGAAVVASLTSVGTTLGIAALVVVALPPTWRLQLRLRPVFGFPPGVARQAGGLLTCVTVVSRRLPDQNLEILGAGADDGPDR